MSDYTQIVNFTAKDALASGDPAKLAKGTELDAELAAISTAITSKADDSLSAHLAGVETLTGNKTFSGNSTFSGTIAASGANSFSGINTFTKRVIWNKGADIVSAATLVLGTDGNMFDVTGATGPITAITVPAGKLFLLQFDSTPTLTHHATNLNLPGAADIVVEAGDRFIGYATAANQVHVFSYVRASGIALTPTLTLGADTALSGATADRAIPAWVKRITVSFASLSTNGTSAPIIQIGDASSFITTGYVGAVQTDGAASNHSSGFLLITSGLGAAGNILHGSLVLSKMDTTKWTCMGGSGKSDAAIGFVIAGSNNGLATALTRIRLTMVNGTDVFDGGTFNVSYD